MTFREPAVQPPHAENEALASEEEDNVPEIRSHRAKVTLQASTVWFGFTGPQKI